MDLFELENKLQEKLQICAEIALANFIADKSSDRLSKFDVNSLYVQYKAPYVQIRSHNRAGNISFKVHTAQSQSTVNDPQADFEIFTSHSFFDDISDFLNFFKKMSSAMFKMARVDFRKAATGLKNINVKHVLNQVYFAHDVLADLGYHAGGESYARFDPISWAYGVGIDCKVNEQREVSLSFFKSNIDDVKGYLGSIVNKTQANSNVFQIEGDLVTGQETSIPSIFKLIKDAENGSYR